MCTPEKTGVEAWQSLWVVRAGGPMIKNGAIPKYVQRPCSLANASRVEHYMLLRNPYERLLSGYLDVVARQSHHHGPLRMARSLEPACTPQCCGRVGCPRKFNATPAGFAEFVRELVELTRANRSIGNGWANMHLRPIAMSNCQKLAERTKRVVQLKLELQEYWYDRFLSRIGAQAAARDGRWPSGCFWRNPAVAAVNGSGTCGSSRSVAGAACHGHASCSSGRSGSCSKMAAFYSEETAALVTEYSQADLDRYDYPAWSPSADKPLPEGCTGEVETSLDPLIGGSP